MDLTLDTAGADPVPAPAVSRSTSTDDDVVANAHRPSGVAATPNGLPPVVVDVVPAGPSRGPEAVALEQPGDASARPGSGATAAPEAEAEAVADADVEVGRADDVAPGPHPAVEPRIIAATRQAAVPWRLA
jgi:hypothetical protein